MARPPSDTTEKLKAVYKEFGPRSPEFYVQVRPFFVWLQTKYMGDVDDDLTQRCYERFLQSLPYFDPKKISNIVSWAYSVGRHQISSYLHRKKKRLRESSDGLEAIVDKTRYFDSVEKQEFSEQFLKNFERIEVEEVSGTVIDDLNSGNREAPLIRHILWEHIGFV